MKKLSIVLGMFIVGSMQLSALTGNQILKKVENELNRPKDRKAFIQMELKNSDGSDSKTRTMILFSKGKDLKLIKFLSPADQKNVGFLVLNDDNMYLWMPAFRRIRRIASHVKKQSFQGTDFSYDDIGTSDYTKHYSASIVETTDKVYLLKLTRKAGSKKEYKNLKMWVRKDVFLPKKVEMLSGNGKVGKIMQMAKIKKIKGYNIPTEIEITDINKSHTTKMIIKRVKMDTGMTKRTFTIRYLKKRARSNF